HPSPTFPCCSCSTLLVATQPVSCRTRRLRTREPMITVLRFGSTRGAPYPGLRHNGRMDMKVYAQRRAELLRHMQGGVAIIPTAPVRVRNRDVDYPYRPDSDFYYLTHFPEPEAVAVLVPGRPHGEYILFCRERNPEKEIWDGRRAGLEGARTVYGADDAFPIDDIDDILPGLLENREKV